MAALNYFTCTLGQAAILGLQQPHKTINKLVDAVAAEYPHKPAIGFAVPPNAIGGPWTQLVLTFRDIKLRVEERARLLLRQNSSVLFKRQTVALLCPSTLDFLLAWLGLVRLGHAVLLIAPQCQPAAIATLCQSCEVGLLISDEMYAQQAQQASELFSSGNGWTLQVSGLQIDGLEDDKMPLPVVDVNEDEVAYLHHTSGTSSGMPKPIPQTHKGGVGVLPAFNDGDHVATFTTTPLYHGGVADLFRAWTSHAMIWLFPGKGVPITAHNIIRCLEVADETCRLYNTPPVKYFSSVPYVLQMMEADELGLQYLRQMDIVGVGGAALPPEVGDRLVAQGVNLISRFGSAECGFLLSSHRDYSKDREWQYLRVAAGAEKLLRFDPNADNSELAELVVLSEWPHMAKRNRENGSFATSDLFERHPTIFNAWRYHSRADSQLTLITGKKFDPAPLEASLAASELLEDVLIFGNGRPYPGVLLFRSQQAENTNDAELVQRVLPLVEKLNSGSQDHARIPKSMLVPMAVLEKPLEKSSKGTLLRGAVEKRFERAIENAYDQIDRANGSSDVPDDKLTQFIQDVITQVVAKHTELTATTDLFNYGVDSVAGMQVRSRLRLLLPPNSKTVPINIVEDCGTIERLADYVRQQRHGKSEWNGHEVQNEHEYMRELVETYSRFGEPKTTAPHPDRGDASNGEVIVLTGATGALGAHVLNQYRHKPGVKRIHCLVRGADEHAAYERVNKALLQRQLPGLDVSTNHSEVSVWPTSLGERHLGLSDKVYNRVAGEATIIMHIAWSVNFRMKLRSFVKDNVTGVTNLINLALASPRPHPPRFAFCSSVASALAYHSRGAVPESIIEDPSAATSLGYSQSKWVAEQICQRAATHTRLRGRISIYRVGQLAGDSGTGVWNAKEAWPMMLSAVKVTGCLPDLPDEKLDWLPVDIAATALIEGAAAETRDPPLSIYHVLNDHQRPSWREMLHWLRNDQDFEVVSAAKWVSRLETAVNDGSTHPSAQLLDHWRSAYAESEEQRRPAVRFDMAKTKETLPALRDVRPVDKHYFDKLWTWIKRNI